MRKEYFYVGNSQVDEITWFETFEDETNLKPLKIEYEIVNENFTYTQASQIEDDNYYCAYYTPSYFIGEQLWRNIIPSTTIHYNQNYTSTL